MPLPQIAESLTGDTGSRRDLRVCESAASHLFTSCAEVIFLLGELFHFQNFSNWVSDRRGWLAVAGEFSSS